MRELTSAEVLAICEREEWGLQVWRSGHYCAWVGAGGWVTRDTADAALRAACKASGVPLPPEMQEPAEVTDSDAISFFLERDWDFGRSRKNSPECRVWLTATGDETRYGSSFDDPLRKACAATHTPLPAKLRPAWKPLRTEEECVVWLLHSATDYVSIMKDAVDSMRYNVIVDGRGFGENTNATMLSALQDACRAVHDGECE